MPDPDTGVPEGAPVRPREAPSGSPTATTRASGSTSTRRVGERRGLVVVIHGGFWRSAYGADPTASRWPSTSLARGWTACDIEYRRVGNGGGTPETFDYVAAAHRRAGRRRRPRPDDRSSPSATPRAGTSRSGRPARFSGAGGVALTHVDLPGRRARPRARPRRCPRRRRRRAPASATPPAPTTPQWDPQQQTRSTYPCGACTASTTTTVPLGQSEGYVVDAHRRRRRAEIIRVEGDHFVVIDPGSRGLGGPAWRSSTASPDPPPRFDGCLRDSRS